MAGNFYQVSNFLVNQSLGATFTSDAFRIGEFDHVGLQAVITGSSGPINGSFQLQRSVDGSSWDNFQSAEAITADVVFTRQIADIYFGFIRIVYTRTAGSGTLNVKLGTVNHAL